MARRKAKKTRRKDKAVSITGLAEAILLANVGTKAAFNLSAWDFVTDGWTTATSGRAYGAGQISLHEMIYGNYSSGLPIPIAGGQTYTPAPSAASQGAGSIVMSNLQANWVPAVIQTVAIPAGFKVARRLMRKPITQGNKLLKAAGLRSMVKI